MNSQILSAVLIKWAEPFLVSLAQGKILSLPFIANIDSKVRSLGWVSNNWTLVNELSPFAGHIVKAIAVPILDKYISNIPDEAIPSVAHSIVDDALTKGELSIFEGHITFSKEDMNRLKALLNANLPAAKYEPIKLKEDESC